MNSKNSRVSPLRNEYNEVHTSQPGGNLKEWRYKRLACCEDMKECCCAFCCLPCFMCRTFKRANETCCSCLLGGVVPLRTKIRVEKRIKGSVPGDFCSFIPLCFLCTLIQMSRELKE